MVEEISTRKEKVLKAIIQEHILTAEPVGSRTLARKYDFDFSPATIRNEMADLEEMGFLEQPHTSAGRIPSDLGYRFYVDRLMEGELEKPVSLKSYLKELSRQKSGVEDIMSGMARMLSRMVQYTAIVSEPGFSESKISRLELLPVSSRKLLLIVITSSGLVNDKIIQLEKKLTEEELENLNRILSRRLAGRKVSTITGAFLQDLEEELKRRLNYAAEIIKRLEQEITDILDKQEMKIYLDGTSYILEQPEFNDIQSLKKILKVLDRQEELRRLVAGLEDELEVKIGAENKLQEMQNCSLVVATYRLEGGGTGRVGVIGPTRMEYPRVISSVDLTAELISKFISSSGR